MHLRTHRWRGKFRSKGYEAIMNEVRMLAADGCVRTSVCSPSLPPFLLPFCALLSASPLVPNMPCPPPRSPSFVPVPHTASWHAGLVVPSLFPSLMLPSLPPFSLLRLCAPSPPSRFCPHSPSSSPRVEKDDRGVAVGQRAPLRPWGSAHIQAYPYPTQGATRFFVESQRSSFKGFLFPCLFLRVPVGCLA